MSYLSLHNDLSLFQLHAHPPMPSRLQLQESHPSWSVLHAGAVEPLAQGRRI